jgi:hypothetical protein
MAKKKDKNLNERYVSGTPHPISGTADKRKITYHYSDSDRVRIMVVPDPPLTREQVREFRKYLRERFGE